MPSKNPSSRKIIKISSIIQKNTTRGKAFWTVTDESDDYYSVFDEFVRSRLKEGETMALMVEIAERSGKAYKNIVGIADGPVATTGEVNVGELLPGNAQAPLQQIQQQSPASQSPPPSQTQKNAGRPLNVMTSMVDVRIAALHASTQLCASGVITAAQIEHNSKEFEKYIIGLGSGEQNISSEGSLDEYID